MDHPNLPFGFALPGHPPIPPTANMMSAHPSAHPGPTASPPQSVPGRRTPLGSVGLGGFYAQGLGMIQGGGMPPGDENKSDSGSVVSMDKTVANLIMGPSTSAGLPSSLLSGPAGGNVGGGRSRGGSGGGSLSGLESDSGSVTGGGGKQKNRQGKTVRLNINAR